MATLEQIKDEQYIKMLLIGDSGTGKTGSLASLVDAGYKLRILDFDNGLHSLIEATRNMGDKLKNIEVESLHDEIHMVGNKIIPKGVPHAFSDAMKLLTKWSPSAKKGASELGKPAEWGQDTVLVIDSLTHMSNACLRLVQTLNSNAGNNVTQPEWGTAQRMVESMLSLLYSKDFKCHVVIMAHIAYLRSEDKLDTEGNPIGKLCGHPMSLGQALPPKIPSYFNIMLQLKTKGSGALVKRIISTVPDEVIKTKSPILNGVPKELPLETGLAQYFTVALGNNQKGE